MWVLGFLSVFVCIGLNYGKRSLLVIIIILVSTFFFFFSQDKMLASVGTETAYICCLTTVCSTPASFTEIGAAKGSTYTRQSDASSETPALCRCSGTGLQVLLSRTLRGQSCTLGSTARCCCHCPSTAISYWCNWWGTRQWTSTP